MSLYLRLFMAIFQWAWLMYLKTIKWFQCCITNCWWYSIFSSNFMQCKNKLSVEQYSVFITLWLVPIDSLHLQYSDDFSPIQNHNKRRKKWEKWRRSFLFADVMWWNTHNVATLKIYVFDLIIIKKFVNQQKENN